MRIQGNAIGISESGDKYELTAYDLETLSGYCEVDGMIGRDWCRFERIIPE